MDGQNGALAIGFQIPKGLYSRPALGLAWTPQKSVAWPLSLAL